MLFFLHVISLYSIKYNSINSEKKSINLCNFYYYIYQVTYLYVKYAYFYVIFNISYFFYMSYCI